MERIESKNHKYNFYKCYGCAKRECILLYFKGTSTRRALQNSNIKEIEKRRDVYSVAMSQETFHNMSEETETKEFCNAMDILLKHLIRKVATASEEDLQKYVPLEKKAHQFFGTREEQPLYPISFEEEQTDAFCQAMDLLFGLLIGKVKTTPQQEYYAVFESMQEKILDFTDMMCNRRDL
jgi:hypothetical protein